MNLSSYDLDGSHTPAIKKGESEVFVSKIQLNLTSLKTRVIQIKKTTSILMNYIEFMVIALQKSKKRKVQTTSLCNINRILL